MFGGHGIIGFFVRHRNASHLLMATMIIAGLFSLTRLNTQFFPTIGLDFVVVSVAWPGAAPTDVENNIVATIEPEVRFLDSVKRVFSFSREGATAIVIEFESGSDMQAALSEVEAAVGRVTTLPADVEKPLVRRVVPYDPISRILISGPFTEASLKVIAKTMRDDLLAAGIDQITLFGTRADEIWVEVKPSMLRRMDLTLEDIARRIGSASQDVPSGTLEGSFEKTIRSVGLATNAESVGEIEVHALQDGEVVYLRDVAQISESQKQQGRLGLRHGKPAIELFVQRSTNADALMVADVVQDYLRQKLPTLPPELRVEVFDVQAEYIRERIGLLLRNGLSGLILVLTVLFVFLSGRVAFWVAVGIPTSIMATLAVMMLTGQTINMVSMFALIMTLGIIVDDAIVVGEHAASRRAAGSDVIDAAETGAKRMVAPVLSSSLTTIAAFVPIAMIGDVIGQVIIAIPFVVVSVILASLVECFYVLPGHLRRALPQTGEKSRGFRLWFDEHFNRFRTGPFRKLLGLVLEWRYLTMAAAIAMLMISIGLIIGGRVTFEFFPSPEPETINANASFAPGTPRARTEEMIREMERALEVTEQRLTNGEGGLVVMSFGKVGASQGDEFSTVNGDHLGGLHVELVPGDQRDVLVAEFIKAWRKEIRELPGTQRISINPRLGGPPGRELDIRLSGGNVHTLKAAAREVEALLERLPGVSDVEDDQPYGKQEVILNVTEHGSALGFTTENVGRQVRNAFEGKIAKRFPRGGEEVSIRVQYPRGAISAATLRDLYLRSPSGAEVPLSEVIEVRESVGFARIRREDGQRQIAVVGEIDEQVTSAGAVIAILKEGGGVPEIAEKYGLGYAFKGKAEEQSRALTDVQYGALVGLAAIYIILAWVFGSYSQPLVIMAIIPFGAIGAILGHLVMGFNLTMLSLIALLGLSGILVNDSIILVSVINERIKAGQNFVEAITKGTEDRLRAVLLTSLTTCGGLLPLIFETSLQARFLIPMAITIVFGLLVATFLVLLVVPALLGILEDLKNVRLRRPLGQGISDS